ncbi:hypothetical protein SH1V18_13340 [Vallitalea longa]|uniref:Uncharacterized protein n=1 Tax=Vallitalea longa TaxID=2936439 RepID=A0A9W5YBE0_9FIRM|nr:hypothetical protein [Vallitalea longa]GKX28854.1 hypothetical protein SH1V18_13340 [Vallitalea longa]
MSECKECYSSNNRITPLLKPRECLENHIQYICGTCGRCICINKDERRGLQRWNFPFKTLEIAKLYLRTAEVSTKIPCGIYEITDSKGRKSYKIFKNVEELNVYLCKNKQKSCTQMKPVFQGDKYEKFQNAQVRRLTTEEVENYLLEQKNKNL